jgi:hypothetical protein
MDAQVKERLGKFAAACRSVADDVASGRLRPGRFFTFELVDGSPCCSIGHVLSRAGYKPDRGIQSNYTAFREFVGTDAFWFDRHDVMGDVAAFNDVAIPDFRPHLVAEKLRELADELESQADRPEEVA